MIESAAWGVEACERTPQIAAAIRRISSPRVPMTRAMKTDASEIDRNEMNRLSGDILTPIYLVLIMIWEGAG